MASPSYNAKTTQERWHQFSDAAVRAFHRYATWLVSLSWWRFGWYALLLVIVTGLIQKLPPFSMTYVETIVESARHHKPRTPAVPVAPAVPVVPGATGSTPQPAHVQQPGRPEQPERAEKPERADKPEAASESPDHKTVNIDLPGITVDTAKDHPGKNKGVNISFTGNGIHITTDDAPEETAAASAASVAASAASAARVAAMTAKDRAEAARHEAVAQRDAALAKAMAARAAAEQARAARLSGTPVASAAASAAAPVTAASAPETAVDMVVGGQHIRIAVPSHADAEDVRNAVNEAKESLMQSLKDAEEAKRGAEQEARDAARAAKDAARGDDGDEGGDNDDEGDGQHRSTREHTVHYGNLPMLAVWWILGSMLVKITYKGRMQAEVKAAVATETAEAESLRRQVLEARMAMMQAKVPALMNT